MNLRKIAAGLPLLVACSLCNSPLFAAQSVLLGWSASPSQVAGYNVYYGIASGAYSARIDAGTNLTCIVPNLEAGLTYYFVATAYDSSGVESIFSGEVTYSVPISSAPTISAQPVSTTNTVGTTATFMVSAIGPAPLYYQWFKAGTPITGANAAILGVPNITVEDAGSYWVTVSNVFGAVTSSAAALTVVVPPIITSQPTSHTNVSGTTAVFNVTASGTAPLSYQWFKGASLIPGASASTLSLASVSASSAGNYSVVVTNLAGTATSSVATLSVIDAPTITGQPQSLTNIAGGSVSFSVVAAGTGPLTYQWFKSGLAVSGATLSSLTLGNISTSDSGSYYVIVTNLAGALTSSSATLTVILPPVIVGQPLSVTNVAGTTANFAVTAVGSAPFRYQWMKSGAPLAAATNSTLSFTNVSSANAGSYSVTVTNLAGSVTSAIAILTVISLPTITSQPVSLTNVSGTTASFSVTATSPSPMQYQWLKSGILLSGQTNAALVLANVSSNSAGGYSVTVSNVAGSVTSSVATLTVITAPVITSQPKSQTNTAGSQVTFTVGATGSAPLNYQWFKAGTRIAGATKTSLVLSSISSTDAGNYTVTVSNLVGSATSSVATLTVTPRRRKSAMSIALVPVLGHQYEVQASTNLVDWATIWQSGIITNSSNLEFQDPETGLACRFYRWIEK